MSMAGTKIKGSAIASGFHTYPSYQRKADRIEPAGLLEKAESLVKIR